MRINRMKETVRFKRLDIEKLGLLVRILDMKTKMT